MSEVSVVLKELREAIRRAPKISEAAAPAITELGGAPYVLTGKSTANKFFPVLEDPYIPAVQEDLPRQQGRGGNYTPRMQKLLDSRNARQKMDKMINAGKDLGMRTWYGTEGMRQAALNEGMPEEDFSRMMAHLASASQRNPVSQQNRMGSVLWQLDKQGLLTPDSQLWTKAKPTEGAIRLPDTYGSLAQTAIFDRAKQIANGGIGEALPPDAKLGTFYRNLMGNRKPVTVDVNAVRGPVMSTKDPAWLASKVVDKNPDGSIRAVNFPRQDYASGALSMRDLLDRPGLWEAAPKGSEYGGFEELWQRAAKRHGVDPAEGQALGWYGSGDITALKSAPELYQDNFERLMKMRAQQLGQPVSDVWKSIINGEEHLAAGGAVGKGLLAKLRTLAEKLGSKTAYGTYEAVPGVGLNHFPDLEGSTDAARDLFSQEPSRQWTDERGKDLIYGALGVPQRSTLSSQGIWQGANGMELNAGHAARPRVQMKPASEGGGMADSSKSAMSAAEFTRALLDAQAAGAGHVLDPRSANATALAMGLDRPLGREEAVRLQALGAKLGLPDLVDRGRGVTMTGFEKTPSIEDLRSALDSGLGDQASEILGQRVVPQGAALDSVFEPVYMQGTEPGSGALTRQWLDKLGESGVGKLQGSQPFRQRVREKAAGNAERGKRTGAPYRQDLQNLLEIVGDPQQGPASLPDALRRGVALPSALLGAGALYGQEDSDGS